MMCVKNYVDKSPIQGLGLFAKEAIPRGTLIWKFNPIVDREYTDEDLKKLPHDNQLFIRFYSYKVDEDTYVLPGDNGRYFNHSDDPNTLGVESEDGYGISVAVRDIGTGEEITYNYNDDMDFNRKKSQDFPQ